MTTGCLFPHWWYWKSMNKCSEGRCSNFITYLLEKASVCSHYPYSSNIFTHQTLWNLVFRSHCNLSESKNLLSRSRQKGTFCMLSVTHKIENMIIMVSCMFISLNLHDLEEKERSRVKHENTREQPRMSWVRAKPFENGEKTKNDHPRHDGMLRRV